MWQLVNAVERVVIKHPLCISPHDSLKNRNKKNERGKKLILSYNFCQLCARFCNTYVICIPQSWGVALFQIFIFRRDMSEKLGISYE